MSHHDDEKDLAGTAKHLKAIRQYRALDDNFKEMLDLEKKPGSEFNKALDDNYRRVDGLYNYQHADEDTRKISRENGIFREDGSATSHSDAIDLNLSDQIALEDLENKKLGTKK